jgi:hypothetical protein
VQVAAIPPGALRDGVRGQRRQEVLDDPRHEQRRLEFQVPLRLEPQELGTRGNEDADHGAVQIPVHVLEVAAQPCAGLDLEETSGKAQRVRVGTLHRGHLDLHRSLLARNKSPNNDLFLDVDVIEQRSAGENREGELPLRWIRPPSSHAEAREKRRREPKDTGRFASRVITHEQLLEWRAHLGRFSMRGILKNLIPLVKADKCGFDDLLSNRPRRG